MPIKNISSSARKTWLRNKDEFYLSYLAPHRMQRSSQMQAAAIGSGFDAQVKSKIAQHVFGSECPDTLRFEPLFESQVDEAHRDWARTASEYAFKSYELSGRYAQLLEILEKAATPPQFEDRIYRAVDGIPLMGLPDCSFITYGGYRVILDWKVRGFCGKRTTSPTKLYIGCYDAYAPFKKAQHKGVKLLHIDDVPTHDGWMEHASKEYADQLAMYLWLKGEAPGDTEHIVMIDELVCKPNKKAAVGESNYPLIRVAAISARVSEEYQLKLLAELRAMWEQIQSGHIFDEMTREASDVHCRELDGISTSQTGLGSSRNIEFGDFIRSQYRFF